MVESKESQLQLVYQDGFTKTFYIILNQKYDKLRKQQGFENYQDTSAIQDGALIKEIFEAFGANDQGNCLFENVDSSIEDLNATFAKIQTRVK